MEIRIWHCNSALALADSIGHIYLRLLGSTLADAITVKWFQIGAASFATLDDEAATDPAALDNIFAEAVAWYLTVGHGAEAGSSYPSNAELTEAKATLGPGAHWTRTQVAVLCPELIESEECFRRWVSQLPAPTWSAVWTSPIDLTSECRPT